MDVIDVAAALIFRDGKLLITQRPADAHLGGLWEFPGGKREPDEMAGILEGRDRRLAGPTSPAHGLCFTRATYEEA